MAISKITSDAIDATGFNLDSDTLTVDSTNNRVGIGTASPAHLIDCRTTGETEQVVANFSSTGDGSDRQRLEIYVDPSTQTTELYGGAGGGSENNTNLAFSTRQGGSGRVEAMRIDSSGRLLVGKTTNAIGTVGHTLQADGFFSATRDGSHCAGFNRLSDYGSIVEIRKDGTLVGSINTQASGGSGRLAIGNGDVGLWFLDNHDSIAPFTISGNTSRDNAIDLGFSSIRFDDIYATNGTIQTSDQNEKQQIASLTSAEITAAKAISKLFKTFKWKDAVAEKSDSARTHAGVIAQDVQQAMTDAGLDAGDYAFFISTTWWETQTDTRTDIYDTADEAPEGATERTRLGIRYPELLAFVGAATEQRLTHLETLEARIETLENA